MNKHEIKRERTIQKLLDAFWSLYSQKDISKITVKSITDTAGVYRSTFYLYFTDVYQMLNFIEDDILSYWENTIIPLTNMHSTDEIIHAISLFHIEKGAYISVLIGAHGDPLFTQKMKQQIIPHLQKNPEFSSDNPMSDIKINFLLSGSLSAFSYWYQNEKIVSVESVVQYIQTLIATSANI